MNCRLDFRRLLGGLRAHYPEQRLVIEPILIAFPEFLSYFE